jgi:NTP pyrophosphatase (non-canonical NTP hydrolase)
MATQQSDIAFEEISQKIIQHIKERDWTRDPRSLAISIALESNELLEHYQWSDTPVGSKAELAEELADIFIYGFQFAQIHNIDIPAAMIAKLEKAGKKYPADKFKGKSGEERNKAWLQSKAQFKKKEVL